MGTSGKVHKIILFIRDLKIQKAENNKYKHVTNMGGHKQKLQGFFGVLNPVKICCSR